MQAITTTYHGATNTKPSKIIAKTASGIKLARSYEHGWTTEQNHEQAAYALAAKLNWTTEPGTLLGGGLSDSSEVWVMIPRGYKLVQVGE